MGAVDLVGVDKFSHEQQNFFFFSNLDRLHCQQVHYVGGTLPFVHVQDISKEVKLVSAAVEMLLEKIQI